MLTYDTIKQLCKEKGVTITKTEKDLGFSRGSLCKINTNKPSIEKVQKLADYFHVPVEALMSGTQPQEPQLNRRDERDIAKDLDNIMYKISNHSDGPTSFNGEELSPEALDLFREELEIALKRLKILNKELYNPNKNKHKK